MLYCVVMRKYILPIFVFIAASMLNVPLSYGSSNADHECTKCHKLSLDEAQSIIQGGIPASKVLEVNPGSVKGVWEIVFEVRGQKGIVYVGFSKELLIDGHINQSLKQEQTSQAKDFPISTGSIYQRYLLTKPCSWAMQMHPRR